MKIELEITAREAAPTQATVVPGGSWSDLQYVQATSPSVPDFSWALKQLRRQIKVQRSGWNGKGMYVGLHNPSGRMTIPYFFICTVDGELVPWLPSQTDLLATDWSLYVEEDEDEDAE
jgi:hypothetical protein